MKESKNEKGITLIALVVTIIILLILAGVAIVTLTGENGLLKRANKAVEATKEAEVVEIIELQLMSCRTEYILNNNMDIPSYVAKENKDIETEIDIENGGDGTPLSNWIMRYKGYEFEIYDLQIKKYAKQGNRIKPLIKDINVKGDYQLKTNGGKVEISFRVELPAELSGATVNVNILSDNTTSTGSYDNATNIYSAEVTANDTYIYEVKATKDNTDYISKAVINVDKFLDDLNIEAIDIQANQFTIKVTNDYPNEISYGYYLNNEKITEKIKDSKYVYTSLEEEKSYDVTVKAYIDNNMISSDDIQVQTIADTRDETAIRIPKSTSVTQNMIASSTFYEANLYYAFDGIKGDGSLNQGWAAGANEQGSFIGYDFERELKLYKVKITANEYKGPHDYTFVIQGKNTDGTWENIGDEHVINTGTSDTNVDFTFGTNTSKKYSAFRIMNNAQNSGNGEEYWHNYGNCGLRIIELDFYCIEN